MENNKLNVNRVAHAQYYAELRSGKIINIDEGFTKLFGYDKNDMANGLRCMDIMNNVDVRAFVKALRETFVYSNQAL